MRIFALIYVGCFTEFTLCIQKGLWGPTLMFLRSTVDHCSRPYVEHTWSKLSGQSLSLQSLDLSRYAQCVSTKIELYREKENKMPFGQSSHKRVLFKTNLNKIWIFYWRNIFSQRFTFFSPRMAAGKFANANY